MSNIIDKIRISGVTYTISGSSSGGNPTVELTQAEYDALVESGSVQTDTYYIITDAPEINLSGYAQTSAVTAALSNYVPNSAVTTAVTSASTNSEIPSALAVYAATSGSSGGATYSAGTNISIDTGNTISCTIPAYFNSNTKKGDIRIGTETQNTDSDYYRIFIGRRIHSVGSSSSNGCIGIGTNQSTNSEKYSYITGQGSIGIGSNFYVNGSGFVAIGNGTTASGTTKMNLNNQIKVDTSNQVYISNSANTSTYCLQTKLETTEAALGGLKLVKISQSDYDLLPTKDSNTLYIIT